MSIFAPKIRFVGKLKTLFHLKKTAVESYQLLVEAYGEQNLTHKICE